MHALIRAAPAQSSMFACACLDVCVFCQGRIGHDDRDTAFRTVASAVSTLLAGASFGFENPEECPHDLAVDASNPRRVQLMVRLFGTRWLGDASGQRTCVSSMRCEWEVEAVGWMRVHGRGGGVIITSSMVPACRGWGP
jgi:hypothetical protein